MISSMLDACSRHGDMRQTEERRNDARAARLAYLIELGCEGTSYGYHRLPHGSLTLRLPAIGQ